MITTITDLIPEHAQIEKRDLGYLFGMYTGYNPDNYDRAFRDWADLIEEIFNEDLGMKVRIVMQGVQ